MIKDGYEDRKRYLKDMLENNSDTLIFINGKF